MRLLKRILFLLFRFFSFFVHFQSFFSLSFLVQGRRRRALVTQAGMKAWLRDTKLHKKLLAIKADRFFLPFFSFFLLKKNRRIHTLLLNKRFKKRKKKDFHFFYNGFQAL